MRGSSPTVKEGSFATRALLDSRATAPIATDTQYNTTQTEPSLTVGLLPRLHNYSALRSARSLACGGGLHYDTENVTSRILFAGINYRATPRRRLGYVLLILIAYGATVDIAHSHGLVSKDLPGAASLSDAGGLQSSNNGHSQRRECSTCQFQQQLFDGLVHAPLFARAQLTELAFVSTLAGFLPSTSATPQSGRAPPLV